MVWSGEEWSGSGAEWSGVEWSGVEWSGVEWCGVEWCGMECGSRAWHRVIIYDILFSDLASGSASDKSFSAMLQRNASDNLPRNN